MGGLLIPCYKYFFAYRDRPPGSLPEIRSFLRPKKMTQRVVPKLDANRRGTNLDGRQANSLV